MGHTPHPTQAKTDDIKWKGKTLNADCIGEESDQESELPHKELQSSHVSTCLTPTLLAVSSPSTDSRSSTAVVYHENVLPMSQVTELFTSVKDSHTYSNTCDQIGGSNDHQKEGVSPKLSGETGVPTEGKHDGDSGRNSREDHPGQQVISVHEVHPVNEGTQSGSTLQLDGHQEGLAGMQGCEPPPCRARVCQCSPVEEDRHNRENSRDTAANTFTGRERVSHISSTSHSGIGRL